MNELLKYSSSYEYDYTGANPLPATPQDDVGTIPYDVSDGGDINFASEASFLGDLKPKTPTADTLETKEEEKNIGTGCNNKTEKGIIRYPSHFCFNQSAHVTYCHFSSECMLQTV